MISITIHPVDQAGKYEARLDGRLLCESHTPFFSAARILIARGYDPAEKLAMYRAGKAEPDLTGELGEAAKLENRRRPLRAVAAAVQARRPSKAPKRITQRPISAGRPPDG
jgi:hypothetical protein